MPTSTEPRGNGEDFADENITIVMNEVQESAENNSDDIVENPHLTFTEYHDKTVAATLLLDSQENGIVEKSDDKLCCDECSIQFPSEQEMQIHKLTHSDVLMIPLSCDICAKRFIRKDQLEAHKNWKHNTVLPFRCDKCSESFRSRYLRDKHKLNHSFAGGFAFTCKICSRKFKSKYRLRKHLLKKHSGNHISSNESNSTNKAEKEAYETIISVSEQQEMSTPSQNEAVEALSEQPEGDPSDYQKED